MGRRWGVGVVVALAVAGAAGAEDNWPAFRGPKALGTSDGTGLPGHWSTTENVLWKVPVPGRGWSCPIVWRDKVFLTSVVSEGKTEKPIKGLYFGGERPKPSKDVHRWVVYCLDFRTGKTLWEKTAHRGVPQFPIHVKNSYASETPVTDGERVYAYFGNQGLYCYDLDGTEKWSRTWGAYKMLAGWGTAASPTLYQDRLFIANDNEEKSFLVCLDARTGKDLWSVPRDERSNWSTPFVWENSQRKELVTTGTKKVRSYDLDGHLLWELTGMSKLTIPTPFAWGDLLFISSGYVLDKNKPVYAIRPGAAGDISLGKEQTANEFVVWCQKSAAPYNPSPLLYGDYLYVLKDLGLLSCYNAKTGQELYRDQRLGATAFTASPWAYGGKVFCLSEEGDTIVVQAGPTLKIVGKNSLNEMCLATPAVVRGGLLVRTESHLYHLRQGARPAAANAAAR